MKKLCRNVCAVVCSVWLGIFQPMPLDALQTPQYQPLVANRIMVGTAGIASAIAKLPSTGGTVYTAPLYTETVTNLAVGSPTKPVKLELGQGSVITVTGSTGVQVFNASAIWCDGALSSAACTIKSLQSGEVSSLFSNGQQDGSQEFFNVSGVTFDCTGAGVMFTNGCVDVNGVFVPSAMSNIIVMRFTNNIGLHIRSSTGASGGTNVFNCFNCWVNGGGNAGAQPLVIDRASTITGSVTSGTFTVGETVTQATSGATGVVYQVVASAGPLLIAPSTGTPDASDTWTGDTSGAVFTPTAVPNSGTVSQVQFYGGAIEHPGLGYPEIRIDGKGTAYQMYNLAFYGTQVEGTTSNTVADVYGVDVQLLTISAMTCSHHPTGLPCIELQQTVNGGLGAVSLINVRGGGQVNSPIVKNDVTGFVPASGTYELPNYTYSGSANSSPAIFDGGTRFTVPPAWATESSSPDGTVGANMLLSAGIDPSFETGTGTLGTLWASQCISDAGCIFTRDGTTAAPGLGTYSQEITVATAGGRDQIQAKDASWSVTAGSTYVISYWAKSDGGGIAGAQDLADNAESTFYCAPQYITLTAAWQKFSTACVALASGSGTNVVLRLSNRVGSGTGHIWFDGVELAPLTISPYSGFGPLAAANVDGASLQLVSGIASLITIANGTFTFAAQTVAANTCTAAATVTMTGVTSSAVFEVTPTTDVTGVTGWGSTGGLVLRSWATANTFNYRVCNQTAAGITTGSDVTFQVAAHNSGR